MRSAFVFVVVLTLSCGVVRAQETEAPTPRPYLKSIYASVHGLEDLVRPNTKGLALVFLGTECPVARQYVPRLNELYENSRSQGVEFVGVFSDTGVDVFAMASYAHDEDIHFPVVQDVDQRLADKLEVRTTPEVVLLDRQFQKIYQGAIDDQIKRHGRRPTAGANYLEDAVNAVVAGKPVGRTYVPASGCPLERRVPQRSPRHLTYYKDIEPLVQKHCVDCHRNGGPGPFALETYDDVALNSEKIREVVVDRRMPPWHGVLHPDFGELKHNQQLPDEERQTFLAWIEEGAAEGDPPTAPVSIERPSASQWVIGQPDFVYRMPKPFPVPKFGTLDYQFFRVPLNLAEDRWFRGVEIKPGTPEVVHHITLHYAPASKNPRFDGLAIMAQLYGINGERAQVLSDFVPGDIDNAKIFPEGQAVRIPKHSDLIFEVHYTPNNREATTDQSMVGFQWASAAPANEVHTKIFRRPIGGFRIPPGEHHCRIEDTYYFEHDVEIDSIRPHFHLRGKSYRLQIIKRDPETDEIESRQTILTVPVYDPAWQRTYELATPLRLKAGTELLAIGHYDNSPLNPNNPDSSVEVLWGQQMTDEMFSTRFKYRLVDQPAQ